MLYQAAQEQSMYQNRMSMHDEETGKRAMSVELLLAVAQDCAV